MAIQDSVARLMRAGDEHSRTTKKLHEAVREVAHLICKTCPVNADLPGGYMVKRVKSNIGSELFLVQGVNDYGDADFWVDGTGSYLHRDFHAWIPAQTREGSLKFAHDVANGLLDQISEWLEKRCLKNTEQSEMLNNKSL